MSYILHEQTSIYSGKFLGFTALGDLRLKYLRLLTKQGEYTIKIPKDQRLILYKTLQPGDGLTATVSEKWDDSKGVMKRKALTIEKTNITPNVTDHTITPGTPKKGLQVLVCNKSDCAKRGSGNVLRALNEKLECLGLLPEVVVKPTGCMKLCKIGPNVVITPQKKAFQQVKQIDTIIELITSRIDNSESPSV